MRDNRVKDRVRRGKAVIGSLVSVPDPFVAEIMGSAGFDFLIVDTEHCPISIYQLQTVLISLWPTESAIIVRSKSNDDVDIKQILDVGAEGILVPNIVDRAGCEAAVAATKYPPLGIRGYGPRRASRLARTPSEYAQKANGEVMLMAMIEHSEALANLDEILTTPGLDAVMVGPADLAVSLGHLTDMTNVVVDNAIGQVLESCKRSGIPFGMFTGTAERAATWIGRGAQLATIGGDVPFIDAGIAQAKKDVSAVLGSHERIGE